MADRRRRYEGRETSPELVARSRSVIRRNRSLMRAFRVVAAPLLIVAMLLSVARWRSYALVTLPFTSYAVCLSLYYVMERFREMAEPLLLIPLAALLADVLVGASDLGSRPSRAVKAAVAGLAVFGSVVARATEFDRGWYALASTPGSRMTAIRAPEPDVSALTFKSVSFDEPPGRYKSRWDYRLADLDVTRVDDGLRCSMVGSEDRSAGQYGGIKFLAESPRALRLTLTLVDPENIESLYIAGYPSSSRQAAVQWIWKTNPNQPFPATRTTCILLPGLPSGMFQVHGDVAAQRVADVHVFIRIVPGTRAGFILHQAEVARH